MDSHSPNDPPEISPAVARFNSCRWQRPAEPDAPACCGHRDVLPMAGTTGFNPDSWCVDCDYYKAKRAPKARRPDPEPPNRW